MLRNLFPSLFLRGRMRYSRDLFLQLTSSKGIELAWKLLYHVDALFQGDLTCSMHGCLEFALHAAIII